MDPGTLREEGRRQGEVEDAEHEVGESEIDDEDSRCVVHLKERERERGR